MGAPPAAVEVAQLGPVEDSGAFEVDEIQAIEFTMDNMRATKTNSEFFDMIKK